MRKRGQAAWAERHAAGAGLLAFRRPEEEVAVRDVPEFVLVAVTVQCGPGLWGTAELEDIEPLGSDFDRHFARGRGDGLAIAWLQDDWRGHPSRICRRIGIGTRKLRGSLCECSGWGDPCAFDGQVGCSTIPR